MRLINRHIVIAVLAIILLPKVICADNHMYWDPVNFDEIPLASITSRADAPEGFATITLNTSGDVEISASQEATAQLSNDTDTLITEYKLEFAAGDNGSDNTGPTADDVTASGSDIYKPYNEFLTTALAITHVEEDNDVDVKLWVKARNNTDEVADSSVNSGKYEATQILTVHWVGP